LFGDNIKKESDMTHQEDVTVFETAMELLTQAGFDGFAEAFRSLMNGNHPTNRIYPPP
jgi:hypothetical protein